MRYLAAYLLARLGGLEPTSETIRRILVESDVSVDEAKLSLMLQKLDGLTIDEIIEQGKKKLASVSSAAGAPRGVQSTSGETSNVNESAPVKVEEPEEEDDGPMLDLFGDD